MTVIQMMADTFVMIGVNEYTGIYGMALGLLMSTSICLFFQHFRDAGIAGITRFLNRIWNFVSVHAMSASEKNRSKDEKRAVFDRMLHKTIKKVGEDIENLQYNTAISSLMILLNEFEEKKEIVCRDDMAMFLKLLAPFAPHITEELWHVHGFSSSKKWKSIHREPWPVYKEEYLREETREFAIQINGKLRDTFTAPSHIGEQEAIRLTLEREKVKIFLAGRDPKKVIFVPGRLINIVV